jgi:hypothetical protein
MAKFINKKEEVIQMELTAYGKHKFSRGDFSPSYYSFHDDDILYDSVYASPSGSASPASGSVLVDDGVVNTDVSGETLRLIYRGSTYTATFNNGVDRADSTATVIGVQDANADWKVAEAIYNSLSQSYWYNDFPVDARLGPGSGSSPRNILLTSLVSGPAANGGTWSGTSVGSGITVTALAGATLPNESRGFYEEQNSIVTRIKEMQRLELVTHFTSSMGASSEATTNITNTTFDNVNPGNLKYFRSLGTSSPWDEHMPAWDIKCMETGMPFSGTYSYKALGIPTLTSSLQLEYSVSNGVFEDNNGDQVEIPIFTLEKEDKILIDIQEINTIFKSNGNFEVEVYKIKTDEQGSEDLVKVDFIGDNSKSSDMLKAQSTTEGFARYLNGDEELVGSYFPRMGPEYVEYYLSVRADDEIEFEKEPPGDTLYRSGKVVGPEEC